MTQSWPATTGLYSVGFDSFELTDAARPSAFAAVPAANRRLVIYAWYPTLAGGEHPRRTYFTDVEARYLRGLFPGFAWPAAEELDLTRLLVNGRVGAPVLGTQGLPLVVFNHGALLHPLQSTTLMEEIASHGYVALSIGHPYESGGLAYDDASGLSANPVLLKEILSLGAPADRYRSLFAATAIERLEATVRLQRLVRRASWLGNLWSAWVSDTLFVVDCLEEGAVPDTVQALAKAIDCRRVAYVGMSYGGMVSAMLCQADPRAIAGVNLDGGMMTFDLADTEIRTPMLIAHSDPRPMLAAASASGMTGSEADFASLSPATPLHSDLFFERLATTGARPDVLRVLFPGASHQTFIDLPLLRRAGPNAPPLSGALSDALCFASQRRLVVNFLAQTFGEDTEGLRERFEREFPELIFRDTTSLRATIRSAARF